MIHNKINFHFLVLFLILYTKDKPRKKGIKDKRRKKRIKDKPRKKESKTNQDKNELE